MSVQPVLGPGEDITNGLHLVRSDADGGTLLVFLGVAVLERVRCDPERLQYKLMIGRLVNAGWKLSVLTEHFGHDLRTMKRWAAALVSDDEKFVIEVLSGRGAAGKITAPMRRYIRRRYLALHGTSRRYRQVIAEEVRDVFGVSLSREALRQQFR